MKEEFGSCENKLCGYRTGKKNICGLYLYQNLINDCICRSAFLAFSKTVDIDREFNSGCASYHQWQEIKNGDLPKLS